MFTKQMIVAAHIDELHAAAAAERRARAARRSNEGHGRITNTVNSLWSLLGGPDRVQPVPKLNDYPFRS